MNNINSIETKPGIRHAYAYGHTKKEVAQNFKNLLSESENKSSTAQTFKNLIKEAQLENPPETNE